MARITVRVSDLSGRQIEDDQEATSLIVEHPDFPEPIGLDVLRDEVQSVLSDGTSRFVVLSVEDPENPNPQRYAVSLEEFDRLFQSGDSHNALEQALTSQQEEAERSRSSRGRRGGRRQQTERGSRRNRVDYTSPEHAGEPHRGTISEAEAEIVRNNLDVVNERLRRNGHREIDPTDPEMAARYKFPPPVGRDDIETEGASPT